MMRRALADAHFDACTLKPTAWHRYVCQRTDRRRAFGYRAVRFLQVESEEALFQSSPENQS
jgi:hypothetical protein